MRLSPRLFLILPLLVALFLAAPILAQEAPEEAPAAEETGPMPAADGEERPLAPKPGEQDEDDGEGRLEGDRKVYVPFEKLGEIFEKEGQGVFVPYEEFLKLWEANLDRRPVPEKPPVPHLVTRARYEGRVEDDLAVVDAEIEFETFTEGFSAVPLGFGGVAMGDAEIDGEPATLQATPEGFRVLVPEKGTYVLKLSFVAPVAKKEDLRSVSFRIPPTPVSRLTFDVPEEEARVTVEPNLATTRTEPGSGKTRVMAYVGAADSLSLTWRPKPAEVRTGPPLLFADVTLSASVEETVLRSHADVAWRIFRSPVESLRLEIPEGNRVLFVEGEDIRTWDVTDGVLLVQLHRAREGVYRLRVTLERDRPEQGVVPVPAVRAPGVQREQGFVLVRTPETVKVVPSAEGLYRTDFASVPEPHRAPDLAFAWRYPAHPWSVDLAVERIVPRVEVEGRTLIRIDERSLTGRETLSVNVSRAPVFELRLSVPEGVTVLDVDRNHVEDFRTEGDGVLVLDLKGSKIGAFPVTLTWRAPLSLGEEAVTTALPLLTPLGADRAQGLVGVVRDPSLKIETGETTGLVPVQADAFGEGAALAWRYTGLERSAGITISRRDAEVTARVDTSLRAEENRIAVVARVAFTVKHAGVDEFSFLLPEALKGEFRVEGPDIREKPVTDADDGKIRQRIVLQGKVTGEYVATVEYDLPYEGLASGGSVTLEVPVLDPENVKRDEGTYAIYRESMLEIETPGTDGLEPIDPRELPGATGGGDVFLAFKYLVRPHTLSLTVKKHEPLEILTAIVHHMQLVTMVTEDGKARTEVVLKMTNNGEQFLALRIGADVDELEVITRNAQNRLIRRTEDTSPLEGEEGQILVRMPPEAGPDDVFYVRLVYRQDDELPGLLFHDFSWRAPVVAGGAVPVLVTTWNVYPPVGKKVTQAGGTLTWFDRDTSWLSEVSRAIAEILPGRRTPPERARPDHAVLPGEIADPAPRGQEPLRFGGRVQDAAVEMTFVTPGGFAVLRILVFLLVLAAGVLFFRGRSGRRQAAFVFGGFALALVFAPVAAPGTAEVLSALFFGTAVAGALFVAQALAAPLAERWKSKPETPDAAKGAGADAEEE